MRAGAVAGRHTKATPATPVTGRRSWSTAPWPTLTDSSRQGAPLSTPKAAKRTWLREGSPKDESRGVAVRHPGGPPWCRMRNGEAAAISKRSCTTGDRPAAGGHGGGKMRSALPRGYQIRLGRCASFLFLDPRAWARRNSAKPWPPRCSTGRRTPWLRSDMRPNTLESTL